MELISADLDSLRQLRLSLGIGQQQQCYPRTPPEEAITPFTANPKPLDDYHHPFQHPPVPGQMTHHHPIPVDHRGPQSRDPRLKKRPSQPDHPARSKPPANPSRSAPHSVERFNLKHHRVREPPSNREALDSPHLEHKSRPRRHSESRRRRSTDDHLRSERSKRRSLELSRPRRSRPRPSSVSRERASRAESSYSENQRDGREEEEYDDDEEEQEEDDEYDEYDDDEEEEEEYTEEEDHDSWLQAEYRRYEAEMARYYQELEIYERKMRERHAAGLSSASSHHHGASGSSSRRTIQRRRNSTEEYFKRSLESVGHSSNRNRRFSLAGERSTLPGRGRPISHEHETEEDSVADPEQETVEAAAVLLGLGLSRTPVSHSATNSTTSVQNSKTSKTGHRADTGRVIEEMLSASAQLSDTPVDTPSNEHSPSVQPSCRHKRPSNATDSPLLHSLVEDLHLPHAPDAAAISLLHFPHRIPTLTPATVAPRPIRKKQKHNLHDSLNSHPPPPLPIQSSSRLSKRTVPRLPKKNVHRLQLEQDLHQSLQPFRHAHVSLQVDVEHPEDDGQDD
ncbi:hypothetical protein VP01_4022g1 [Puccinia sorghi]|uniref:Uncharacterized protein n=1 Tax=Puccinia sorghi TaxID=27349 RepID=A0A0L6URW1_9BASI|nr:hypothetical protein VP01_4022g1 [Puccinia sorghi]